MIQAVTKSRWYAGRHNVKVGNCDSPTVFCHGGRRSLTIDSCMHPLLVPSSNTPNAEVEFVNAVTAGGSVKFVASGVNFSIFTNFLCFFLLKLLKLGEIDGVKFLTWKSGGVKFWTNFMSGISVTHKSEICVPAHSSAQRSFHLRKLLSPPRASHCQRMGGEG